MLTRIEKTSSAGMLERIRFDHSACGATALHETIVQKHHAYGPVARPMSVACSYTFPLSHAT